MSHSRITTIFLLAFLAFSGAVHAHFQEIIPNTDIVTGEGDRDLTIDLVFGHPMEGGTMEMAKPLGFGYLLNGVKNDLLESLSPFTLKDHQAWKASFRANRPGDHVFYIEPAPYWEPAEEVMIVHYAKVVVNVMGKERGWDREVGLPAEIVPRVRPYGLWTGNLFTAVVKKDGEPVPNAFIEVEYLNRDGKVSVPSDPFLGQRIRADESGEFCYGIPRAGWWGFAALLDNDLEMEGPEGEKVDVELGAVIWIHALDMK